MSSLEEYFKWAIPLSEDEINNIWDNAIITVDANVLLDLYRVHKDTRNSILSNLKKFEGRIWISHQAATEFFRNRNRVIFDAEVAFKNAKSELSGEVDKKITDIIGYIKGYRKMPKQLSKDIECHLLEIKEKIQEHINTCTWEDRSDYYHYDEVLNSIINLFNKNDSLGSPFNEETEKKAIEEAKLRIENKIPPGYKDKGKPNEQDFGDFFLWEQILCFGEEIKKPIILITSEQKEDWWEKVGGEIKGLRQELQKESWDRLKQHLLVYRTAYFLEKNNTDNNNTIAIEEIKQIDRERFYQEEDNNAHKIFHLERPYVRQHLVKNVEQEIAFSDEIINIGTLSCTIDRPTSKFTVSGNLSPNLLGIPKVIVTTIDCPDHIDVYPYAKTGTTYDFNIHMNSSRKNPLPAGRYTFHYIAEVNNEDDQEMELVF